LSGRKINDSMGKYVAENTVKHMIKGDKKIKGGTVAILRITFIHKDKDSNDRDMLIDVKRMIDRNEAESNNFIYWRL
jgi:UDP-N-acetyl-D-galactosamine dehydrogenase